MAKKPYSLNRALARELDKKVVNYDRVLALSLELAHEDTDVVRFSIDASHIERLGRELVARQETAIAELVKNAYDADATTLKLIFRDSEQPLGSVELIDNGHGMTRQELVDGFMRISTQDKIDHPVSRKYKRERAGRKGIGRFAAQRLGMRLSIVTQTRRSKDALKVTFNWVAYKGHQDLMLVRNKIETTAKERRQGTTLLIEDLREGWSEAQIKRSFRYVADLLQPFPLSKKRKSKTGKGPQDPGFQAVFKQETEDGLVTVSDDQSTFYEHALAVVEGHVDNKGRGYWSLDCSRFKERVKNQRIGPDRDDPSATYKNLRSVHFKAYYFIVKEEYVPRVLIGTIRKTLQKYGGIRLYRNGFRVPPYGDAFDDWLGLDEAYRRRHYLIPLHTNNWLGFIEVSDSKGKHFEETASREGVLDTPAYRDLRDFMVKSLVSGAIRVNELRNVKIKTGPTRFPTENPIAEAEDIAAGIRTVIEHAAQGTKEGKKLSEEAVREYTDRILELGATLEDQISEQQLLRVLAGVGTTIGEFTHEIRTIMGGLKIQFDSLVEQLGKKSQLRPISDDISKRLDLLHSYALYFHDVFLDNIRRDLEVIDLREIAHQFKSIIETAASRSDIKINSKIDGYDLFTRPMHRSEWASILLNLYTNSIKSMNRVNSEGKILLKTGESGKRVYLEFSDDGEGIPEKHKERIFEAFFSTTLPPAPLASEADELTGMGLGLKIVRDIVEGYEGEIFLKPPPKGYSTCFRIEVPRASEAEIPEDAY